MRIGIDFDNTIVSYDAAFHRIASERGLIAPEVAATKKGVRDHLRSVGREDDWTELQGYVYGPGMSLVEPFPGAVTFLELCAERGVETFVISHKTRTPYVGPAHDLHAHARDFLGRHEVTVPAWFELTKDAKLERIATLECTHFIDDLPEFLTDPAFPTGVTGVLFDPNDSEACARAASEHDLIRVRTWDDAADELLG